MPLEKTATPGCTAVLYYVTMLDCLVVCTLYLVVLVLLYYALVTSSLSWLSLQVEDRPQILDGLLWPFYSGPPVSAKAETAHMQHTTNILATRAESHALPGQNYYIITLKSPLSRKFSFSLVFTHAGHWIRDICRKEEINKKGTMFATVYCSTSCNRPV